MSGIQLRRVNQTRKMRRSYSLFLQPDLFGGCDLVREWGRIGQTGTVKRNRYASPTEAQQAQEAKPREKEKGGYRYG